MPIFTTTGAVTPKLWVLLDPACRDACFGTLESQIGHIVMELIVDHNSAKQMDKRPIYSRLSSKCIRFIIVVNWIGRNTTSIQYHKKWIEWEGWWWILLLNSHKYHTLCVFLLFYFYLWRASDTCPWTQPNLLCNLLPPPQYFSDTDHEAFHLALEQLNYSFKENISQAPGCNSLIGFGDFNLLKLNWFSEGFPHAPWRSGNI